MTRLVNAAPREVERSLTGIVILLAIACGIGVSLGRSNTPFGIETAYIFAAASAFACIHLVFVAVGFNGDQIIMPLCAAAAIMGYASVMRLRIDLALRQLGFILIGALLLCLSALYAWRQRAQELGMPALVLAIALLVVTLIFGEERGGARSWVFFAGVGFQPSEFAKIGCVLAGAWALGALPSAVHGRATRVSAYSLAREGRPLLVLAGWAAVVLLTVAQRDVGSAMIIYISCVAMLYVATGDRAAVVISAIAAVAVVWVASRLFGHIGYRFTNWMRPWMDPSGGGYQVIQGFYAIAGGGLFGTGYGVGSPWIVPEAPTDMLFVAMAEEIGLAGSLAVLTVYFLLVSEAYIAAMRMHQSTRLLAAVGAANMIAVQTFVIIGGNLGVLPLTGVTLPFASYGGSSMLTSMVLLGLLMGFAAASPRDEVHEE